MAGETLSIQKDNARLSVIGKSKPDTFIDSGLGLDLGDLDIGSLDPFDLNWQIDIDPLVPVSELPDSIKIITPPTKATYYEGQKIKLDGIVVQAYVGSTIWQGWNGKYPGGYIPQNELHYEPMIATMDISGGGEPVMPDSSLSPFERPFDVSDGYAYYEVVRKYVFDDEEVLFTDRTEWSGDCKFIVYETIDGSGQSAITMFNTIAASAESGKSFTLTRYYNGVVVDTQTRQLNLPKSYEGKRAYCNSHGYGSDGEVISITTSPNLSGVFQYSEVGGKMPNVAWAMIYDNGGDGLPIYWQRPQDGLVLVTHLGITVNEHGGSGR